MQGFKNHNILKIISSVYLINTLKGLTIFALLSQGAFSLNHFNFDKNLVNKKFDLKLRYEINGSTIEREVVRNDDYFLFLDQDYDGIPDSIDNDIDGDGVDNIADEFPTLATKQGLDRDNDGIADFIDMDYSLHITSKERAEASEIQNSIYSRYGILIIPSAKTSLKELQAILDLVELEMTRTTTNLKFVILETQHLMNPLTRGQYDKEWKQLILYKKQLKNYESFVLTLTHEFFHFIQEEEPEFYQSFLNQVGWKKTQQDLVYQHNCDDAYPKHNLVEALLKYSDSNPLMEYDNFPSPYATTSPEEMFAEVGAAVLLEKQQESDDFRQRFINFNEFKSSQAYIEMLRWASPVSH